MSWFLRQLSLRVLSRVLVVVALGVIASQCHGAAGPTYYNPTMNWYWASPAITYGSAAAACADRVAAQGGVYSVPALGAGSLPDGLGASREFRCNGQKPGIPADYIDVGVVTRQNICDAGDSYINSTVKCFDNGDDHVAPCSDTTTRVTATAGSPVVPGTMPNFCSATCTIRTDWVSGDATAGKYIWSGVRTGQTCAESGGTPAPPAVGTPPASSPTCVAGQCLGQVNSLWVCLPCGSPGTKPGTVSSETKTAVDGVKSTTVSTVASGGDGTVASTETTTITNANGTPGGTTTTAGTSAKNAAENPVNEFCENHPDSPVCKKTSWSGTCAGFVCDGDAVQCAIAKEIHTRNCKFYEETNAHTVLGNQMLAGTDPVKNPAALSERTTAAVSGLMTRGRLLSSTCPADVVVAFPGGGSAKLPFSAYCGPLQWVGAIAVVLSLLIGVRIALGS